MSEKVSFTPEGFPTISPYLIVKDGGAALAFYQAVFQAAVDSQMTTPDGRLIHASLRIGDSPVMLGELSGTAAPGAGFPAVSLYVYVEDSDAVYSAATAHGATAISPVAQKFYGNREGGFLDPFGVTWWVATRTEIVSAEEMARRAAQQGGAQ